MKTDFSMTRTLRTIQRTAGDIGSGQQVTVLYEIVPNNGNEKSLKYQDNESKAETNELSGEMLTVSVRYKDPEAERKQAYRQVCYVF